MYTKEQIRQSQLGDLILSSKIKGQYKHIDAIYDAATHNSGIGVEVNSYIANSNYARNVVFRTNFFASELTEFANKKVASVACGSGLEIQRAHEMRPDLTYYIDCYDVDKNALHALEARGLKNINTIQKNVVTQPLNAKYDFIYSVGLFDYLSLKLSKRLINKLFSCLNDNGSLIIGNVDINAPDKEKFMDQQLDWHLIYKSQEELLSLADGLDCDKFVFLDPMRIMNYLKLKKK